MQENRLLKKDVYAAFQETKTKPDNLYGINIIREWINDDDFFKEKILNKGFLLSKYEKQTKLVNKSSQLHQKNKQSMKNNLIRSLVTNPFDYPDYQQLLPLHQLWQNYMKELLQADKTLDTAVQKIVKTDFHGAILQICQSKCKSYQGVEGIVVKETLKSFVIITEENRKLTILKQNTIFLIPVGGKTYKIYGCHLIYRPADRVKIKFKYHKASQFVLECQN